LVDAQPEQEVNICGAAQRQPASSANYRRADAAPLASIEIFPWSNGTTSHTFIKRGNIGSLAFPLKALPC
jgi:hypothetical protein